MKSKEQKEFEELCWDFEEDKPVTRSMLEDWFERKNELREFDNKIKSHKVIGVIYWLVAVFVLFTTLFSAASLSVWLFVVGLVLVLILINSANNSFSDVEIVELKKELYLMKNKEE